ncbi:MAG: hypothetical protein M4579_002160 [Chaenotheca gracillima]|nr:MAG: hypothetical protein M4579_002160 [Chaenotheca gracillima]
MPSKVTSDSPVATRVPAWKKLGLKLKFAKDVPHDDGHAEKDPAEERGRKKRKRSEPEATDNLENGHGPSKSKKPNEEEPLAAASPQTNSNTPLRRASSTPSPKRRKSVAFTPETKAEDGDSVKTLFAAWVDSQDLDARAEALQLSVAHQATPSKADTSKPPRENGVKPEKKSKKKAKAKFAEPPAAEHPALAYLRNYHTSRASWKFNKARQTYLIKHLFDLTQLPSEYDRAICEYIQGLQGAGIRLRIKELAQDVRMGKDESALTANGAANGGKKKANGKPKKKAATEEKATEKKGEGKEKEAPTPEDPEVVRRKEEYDAALARFVEGLRSRGYGAFDDEGLSFATEKDAKFRDVNMSAKKRRRAEIVLWAISQSEDENAVDASDERDSKRSKPNTPADSGSASTSAPGLAPPTSKSRKRKQRTQTTDFSSSSGSDNDSSDDDTSSSGSDSDSSSDGSAVGGGARAEVETSSSSSSSSSSSASGSSASDSGSVSGDENTSSSSGESE